MRIHEFKISAYKAVMRLWRASGLVILPGEDIESVKLKLNRDPDLFLVAEEQHETLGVVMGGVGGSIT